MSIVFEESHSAPAVPLFFRLPAPVIVADEPGKREERRVGARSRTAVERSATSRRVAGTEPDDCSLDLVRRALAGREEALTAVVERLAPIVQARVSRCLLRRGDRVGDRDPREALRDLTQDVFLTLFKDDGRVLRRWDPRRGASLENFVGCVAERQVISSLRRREVRAQAGDVADGPEPRDPSPEASPERRTASRELLQCLVENFRRRLSPLGWTMFEMLFVWDGSVEEVSREMDMNRDAVRKWRTRLRELARQWAESCEKKGWTHG